MKSTDNLLAQKAYRQSKQQLIRLGLEIYEYNGPDTLHAKAALIDNQIAFVGTYNLDPRSSHLNREIGFLIFTNHKNFSFNNQLNLQFDWFQNDLAG